MNWLALAGNLIRRVPIERVLFPPRDNIRELQDFAATMTAPVAPNKAPPEQKPMIIAQHPLEIKPQEAPKVHLTKPQVTMSPEVTVDYQNREIGKLLLRMERHYAQRLRINGVPCDCGSQKHLLDIESLCEETIPMVDNPQVYYQIMNWVKETGPKSTDEAAKSGLHDEEYPVFSHQARDFRKEIIGSLDPSALFPRKPSEPERSTILPVVSEEEREEIRRRAHQKIEQVLESEG